MEVVALPDNGFYRPPAGMNHWQILNAIEIATAKRTEQRGTNPVDFSIYGDREDESVSSVRHKTLVGAPLLQKYRGNCH